MALSCVLLCGRWVNCAQAADAEEQEKIKTAVEALTRLENVNLEEKPAMKAAVERVLAKTRGTVAFVKLVEHFHLTNQNAGLIEVAVNNPGNDSGVAAVRLVLAAKDVPSIEKALQTMDSGSAARVVEVLGHAQDKQTVPVLEPLVTDEQRPPAVRRAAVAALAQTQAGAAALLALAKQDKLPDNLKFLAASVLHAVRWPEIKAAAAQVLPLPAGQNAQPLPPLAELVKRSGDAAQGAAIYRRENVGCIKCHQVRGEGRDVGPALSEIGSKLPKEALFEAILDPSAGISMGFEAWQVQLKSGDDAYGLKASETTVEIAIKDINGLVTRYQQSEVASREQSKISIMPTGLQQTMSTQELVDLVEYLFSLKKQP